MEALVIRSKAGHGDVLAKEVLPIPKPADHQVLVKVQYAAQNPTDIQAFDGGVFGDGAVLGCDFVGTVVETGPGVSRVSKGDTIAGLIWGGEIKGLGAYSAYTIADEHVCFKVPVGTRLEDAATVPLAAITAWLALFSEDCLNINRTSGSSDALLVWGGSSAVGAYTIQIANMFGIRVVTTCSPAHFDKVGSLGAAEVFDYRDKDVVEKITASVPNIRYVFDTIGNETSSATGAKAIQKSEGKLCTVRPGKAFTADVPPTVKVTNVLVWTAFLKDHHYGEFHWPASQGDHQLAREFCDNVGNWLVDGKLTPSKVKLYDNGLDAVTQGFQEHRDGKISGYKIVYKL